MKVTLTDASAFKNSMNIISNLVTEVQMNFSKESLEIIAMDPANAAMVVFRMFSSAFAEYEVEEKETVAINLSMLKQVLRRLKGGEILSLQTENGRLKITLKGNTTRSFSLPIIDIDENETKVPDLTFPVSIAMPSNILNEAVEDVDVVGDSVAFIAEPHKFTMYAEGDLSEANITIEEKDDIKIIVEGTETKIRSKYSVEYLKKMIEGSKLSDRAVLHFNKDYPLKLDYNVVDVLSMSFILAPRADVE